MKKYKFSRCTYLAIFSYVCIFIVTILMILSVYPAAIPSDATNILRHIFLEDRFNDWHPVTYYLFTKAVMYYFGTPHTMVVFHGLLWLYVQFRIVYYLKKYCKPSSLILYTVFSLTFGIAAYEYITIFFKDVPFSISVLGITITLLYIAKEGCKKSYLLELCLWFFFLSCMRHMSWLPVFVGIILFSAFLLKANKKRECISILVFSTITLILFSCFRTYLLNKYELEEPPKYVSCTMPLYMLGGYSVADFELDENIVTTMEKIMPLERWQDSYNSNIYWADTLSRVYGGIGHDVDKVDTLDLRGELLIANVKYFFSHPIDYTYKLFRMNNMVWSIRRPKGGYMWLMPTFGNSEELAETFPEWKARPSIAYNFTCPIISFVKNNTVLRNITYSGGLSFLIILISIVILCIKRRWIYMSTLLPIFFVNCMMLLSIPAQDPRFILPEIMVGCLWPAFALETNE